jgi:hypothetical protein
MPFYVEPLENDPIILITVMPPSDALSDPAHIIQECAQLMAGMGGPIYRIADLSQMDLQFSEVAFTLNEERSGRPGSMTDPRVRNVFIGCQSMVQMAAKSAGQAQYGGISVPVFASLDEAMAHIQSELYA